MKKSTQLLVYVMFILVPFANGQNIKEKSSPVYKSKEKWYNVDYIDSYNNGPVILRDNMVEAFSDKLVKLSSTEMNEKWALYFANSDERKQFITGDQAYFAYNAFSPIARFVNMQSASLINNKATDPARIEELKLTQLDWDIYLSDTKEKIYTGIWVPKNKQVKRTVSALRDHVLHLKEYDLSGSMITDYNVELPCISEDFTVHSTLLYKQSLYILVSVVISNEKKSKKPSKSGFYLYKYDLTSGGLMEQSLTLAEATVISGVRLSNQNEFIFVHGMCREDIKGNNSGFVLSVHDATTLNMIMETKTKFDDVVYKSLLPEKELAKDNDHAIEYMNFKIALVKPNGNIILIGEKNYSVALKTNNYVSYTYYSGDIIASEFTKTGTLLWQRGIQKNQELMSKNTSHYSSMPVIHDNKLHLLFYDDSRNASTINNMEGYTKIKKYSRGEDCVLFCVTIEPDGSIGKKILHQSTKSDDMPTFMSSTFVEANNKVLMHLMNKKKEYRLQYIPLN